MSVCLYSQVCTHTCTHETFSSVLRNPFLRVEESWVVSFPSGSLSGHGLPLSSGNYGEFFLIAAWSQGTQGSSVHRRPVAVHSPPLGACRSQSGAPNSPVCRRCRGPEQEFCSGRVQSPGARDAASPGVGAGAVASEPPVTNAPPCPGPQVS